ncbi:CarD family transcriptional regulator [Aneurinibacillus thermoaerophilus]|nr:CarD family transcriptional regulator [Aneurinibacillus thermoaerophilus]
MKWAKLIGGILEKDTLLEVNDLFQIGDKIVYPMHGAGIIEAIEEKEIQSIKSRYTPSCRYAYIGKGIAYFSS